MGRRPKFDHRDIKEAALALVAEDGPSAATVSALATRIGAPTGSIYHRYASREALLAELWMDVVEEFQRGLVAALAQARDVLGAARAARHMVAWTRANPQHARLLLLHRRQDFVAGEWPRELVARAAALEPQLAAALSGLASRVLGRSGAAAMARVRYALLDAPFGAIKPYVQAREPVPLLVDEMIEETVRAVLAAKTKGARDGSSSDARARRGGAGGVDQPGRRPRARLLHRRSRLSGSEHAR
jgi:AcrR family transcriptional regulator